MIKDAIENFLDDYSRPIDDEGFTSLMMARADAEMVRLARIRRWSVNGAFFVGGATAAIQLPKLPGLIERLSEVDIMSTHNFNLTILSQTLSSLQLDISFYILIGGACMAALMVAACLSESLNV